MARLKERATDASIETGEAETKHKVIERRMKQFVVCIAAKVYGPLGSATKLILAVWHASDCVCVVVDRQAELKSIECGLIGITC